MSASQAVSRKRKPKITKTLDDSANPEPPAVPSGLVTAREVAETLGVSVRTVQHWTSTDRLPAMRIAGTVRYDPAAVAAAVVDRRPVSAPAVAAPEPGRPGVWRVGASVVAEDVVVDGIRDGGITVNRDSLAARLGECPVVRAADERAAEVLIATVQRATPAQREALAALLR